MKLIEDIMRWYHCTEEAAQHILHYATESCRTAGQPLQTDLLSIATAADMPFYIRRPKSAGEMTLADVMQLQQATRRVACGLDKEANAPWPPPSRN